MIIFECKWDRSHVTSIRHSQSNVWSKHRTTSHCSAYASQSSGTASEFYPSPLHHPRICAEYFHAWYSRHCAWSQQIQSYLLDNFLADLYGHHAVLHRLIDQRLFEVSHTNTGLLGWRFEAAFRCCDCLQLLADSFRSIYGTISQIQLRAKYHRRHSINVSSAAPICAGVFCGPCEQESVRERILLFARWVSDRL